MSMDAGGVGRGGVLAALLASSPRRHIATGALFGRGMPGSHAEDQTVIH